MFRRFRSADQKNEIEVETNEDTVRVTIPETHMVVIHGTDGVLVRDTANDEILFMRRKLILKLSKIPDRCGGQRVDTLTP